MNIITTTILDLRPVRWTRKHWAFTSASALFVTVGLVTAWLAIRSGSDAGAAAPLGLIVGELALVAYWIVYGTLRLRALELQSFRTLK